MQPNVERLVPAVSYNLFFPVVEELEFRGFVLGWLLRRGVKTRVAFCIVGALSSLAHAHRFVPPVDFRSVVFTIGIAAWWTWIELRTRNLIGSAVAHASWNIGVLWPLLGLPGNIR